MTARLVIKNGTLIDGSGTAPVANDSIVIEGNLIRDVGRDRAKGAGSNVAETVIDATGQYIMPGLIDGHCHLSLHVGGVQGVRFPSSAEFATLWAARSAAQTLRAGVTSISAPGGRWFVDVTVRDAVNAGLLEGPRIFCAGRALTPYGGIFDGAPSWQDTPDDASAVLCNSVDDFVLEVRRQAKHGVNLVKIADSNRGDTQTVSEAEMKAVVGEAHRRGVRVVIHARGSGSIRAAAAAGVDVIFHADLATDQDLDEVAEAGIPIMPAFASMFLEAEYGAQLGYGPAMLDSVKRQLDTTVRMAERARKRGIALLMGTDSGNAMTWPHGKYHGHEAEIFVKHLGYSPMDAIVANTRLNACTVGLADAVGTIAPGKLADIIVLDADPVADISVLRDPRHLKAVIKDGRTVDLTSQGLGTLPYQPKPATSFAYISAS